MSYSINSNEEKTNTGKLWVVLIGVNTYQDKTISSLNYCANDCRELAEVLTIANQEQQTEIIALYDGGEKQPTRDEVINSIEQFGSAKPEDIILFYFSGHGCLDSDDRPVFLVADSQREDLASTTLPIDILLNEFRKSEAKNQIIWLDACQEEVTDKLISVFEREVEDSKKGQNFYAIFSCDKTEFSWEFSELKHGVFTYYLIEGIKGKAADERGIIEAERLYRYVKEHIAKYIEYRKKPLVSSGDRISRAKGLVLNPANTNKPKITSFSSDIFQTPQRIAKGSEELILGLATPPHARKALIVDSLWNAIANINLCKILQARGGFEVDYRYLKEQENYNIRDTINSYLQDDENKTVLLYLAGKINSTSEPELVFDAENKISLNWLREQLQTSVVREIVIVIDRLEIENSLNLIETLKPNKNKSICLITATNVEPSQRKFIQQLITILEGVKETEFWASELITKLQLWSRKETNINLNFWLSGTTEVMEILLPEVQRSHNEIFEINICPFKSLKSFDVDDAYFFHGREALILEILDKLQSTSFLAVVGASGSGKSSVVKAGVVPQLISQGLYISEQEQFQSCKTWIIRPTDLLQPQNDNILAALAERLQPDNRELLEGILHLGVDSFVAWLQQQPQSISVLVIDQFEELFTASAIDRNKFLDLIIGALTQARDSFKVIITLRDDFLQECLAMSQLAHLIAQNNVLVPSCLIEAEYRQIITQPAKKVGLEVEHELVNLLLQQLEAGSLPLLQFVLEDLHIKRKDGYLTLASYQQEIRELRNILGQKAQETYDKLNSKQQKCAKWIFLSLVQLGEGTEDTRRRLQISELIVDKYKDVFDATLQTLIEARLLVVSRETTSFHLPQSLLQGGKNKEIDCYIGEESNSNQEDIVTVEVAHEILIRNWDTLRWWLQENRSKMRSLRELQQKTDEWEQTHSSQKDGFLLSEAALAKYEEFYIHNPDELPTRVHQFMGLSIEKRDRLKEAEIKRLEREIKLRKTAQRRARFLAIAFIVAIGLTGIAIWKGHQSNINEINALINTSEAQLALDQNFDALITGLKAGRKIKDNKLGVDTKTKIKEIGALQNIFDQVKEFNRLEGHQDGVREIELSPDGKLIASLSWDGTVKLWNFKGKLLHTFRGYAVVYNPDRQIPEYKTKGYAVVFSPDSQVTAVANDKEIQLWNREGKLLATLKGHSDRVSSVVFSPDGQTIASASYDQTVKLWNRKGELLTTLKGHSDRVSSVVFSPDGQTIASASNDQTIKLWNRKGELLHTLKGHTDSVNSVVFSPDGQTIASASNDQTARLWSLDGKLLATFEGHTHWVTKVVFSIDGQTLISAGGYKDRTVRLWSLDGKLLATLEGHTDVTDHTNSIHGIVFSPDGQTLASSSHDKTVKLWNLQGELLTTLKGHSDRVRNVVFSPDGQTIASSSHDKTVKLWNLQGELLHTLKGHTHWVNKVVFNPDGQTLASGSSDGTVKLWSLDGKLLHTFKGHPSSVNHVMFSPDGQTLASANGTVKLWNLQRELLPTLKGHSDRVRNVVFSPDGKTLASAGGDKDKTIKLWSLDGQLLHTLKSHTDWFRNVVFSPDGKTLASAGGNKDKTVKLWSLDGQLLHTLKGHTDLVRSVVFSPDGKTLASSSYDKTVKLWNLQGELLATLTGHTNWVTQVLFSPDGQTLASASWDGTVKLWNIDGQLLHTLEDRTDWVTKVVFSPDGQIIASASWDGTVKLWSLDGQLLHTLKGHADSVNNVVFSPDGKIIASASWDGTVKLWNLQGELLATFTGHNGSVNNVVFSPDGKIIASESGGTTNLWNLQGELLATLTGHTDEVIKVVFSPDGTTIASASNDGTVKLWSLDLDDVLTRGCDWARDYLTNNPNVSEEDRKICD